MTKTCIKICPSDPFICLSNLFAAARIYHSQKMEYQNTFQPTISCDISCTSTKHTQEVLIYCIVSKIGFEICGMILVLGNNKIS